MKINIISYLNPLIYNGGGEMITKDIIRVGNQLGHKFYITSARNYQYNYIDNADLDILIDVFNYPNIKSLGRWIDFPNNFIKKLIKKENFIHISNSYVDICDLDYLPCSGNFEKICRFKPNFDFEKFLSKKSFDNKCNCNEQLRTETYIKSKLNIFLSPLHRDIIFKSNRLIQDIEHFILKPTVDPNMFYNKNINRDIDFLFVGVISEAKGYYNLRDNYHDKNIHFIGSKQIKEKIDFGTYHGFINYEELPNYMNRAKNFVYLPRWPEPQGRVVIEAALCGCNIISNNNVGATSFDFDIANPLNYSNTIIEFFNKISNIC